MKTPEFSDLRTYALGSRAAVLRRRRRPWWPTGADLAAAAGLPEPRPSSPGYDAGPADTDNLTTLAARLSHLAP